MMVCPQKLLISHRLPVLSGSNPEVAYVTTQGVPLPPPPTHTHTQEKKTSQPPPPSPPKKKKKKDQKDQEKKKEGAIFANPPSEDPLVDEPS